MLVGYSQAFSITFTKRCTFKLEGTGALKYHIGCNFSRNMDGMIYLTQRNQLGKIVEACERTLGKRPKQASLQLPLLKDNEAEMDEYVLLNDDRLRQHIIQLNSLYDFPVPHRSPRTVPSTLQRSTPRNTNIAKLKFHFVELSWGKLPNLPDYFVRCRKPDLEYLLIIKIVKEEQCGCPWQMRCRLLDIKRYSAEHLLKRRSYVPVSGRAL